MPYYPPRYLFRRHALLRAVRSGQSFIEIGPGNLLLAQELLHYFQRGTLVEYSADVRAPYGRLTAAQQARLNLLIVDFMTHELAEKYDCVIACEVLEHVEEDAAFLRRMAAVLRPNGQLIFSVPARMKYWSPHEEIVGHVRRYENEPLRALLASAGFTNIQIASYGFPFVNWLRWPRIWFAQREYAQKVALSAEEQTKQSGIAQTAQMPTWLGWLVNPTIIYPLAQISTLFNPFDWSGAYLVSAVAAGARQDE
jgi:SAM-dependent methyltransferase